METALKKCVRFEDLEEIKKLCLIFNAHFGSCLEGNWEKESASESTIDSRSTWYRNLGHILAALRIRSALRHEASRIPELLPLVRLIEK
jgi:hypothetical protein